MIGEVILILCLVERLDWEIIDKLNKVGFNKFPKKNRKDEPGFPF